MIAAIAGASSGGNRTGIMTSDAVETETATVASRIAETARTDAAPTVTANESTTAARNGLAIEMTTRTGLVAAPWRETAIGNRAEPVRVHASGIAGRTAAAALRQAAGAERKVDLPILRDAAAPPTEA